MSHLTVTPDPIFPMPKQQGLLRRGTRYSANFKVPKDLREHLGKEHIRVALKTSDPREASRLVAYERVRWLAIFEEERARLPVSLRPKEEERVLSHISEQEAFQVACRHLICRERQFQEWHEKEGRHLDKHEKCDALSEYHLEAGMLKGSETGYEPLDGSHALQKFLEQNAIRCDSNSLAFKTLRPHFRRAELEHTLRCLAEFQNKPVVPHDFAFREVFAQSPLPEVKPETTLSALIERYTDFQREVKRAPSTLAVTLFPCRLLREYFGRNASLSSITRDAIEGFFREFKRYPTNAAQRYKGLKFKEAIIAADKAKDPRRFHGRTLANNFERISALFNFAVGKKLISENPANDRYMRQSFGTRPEVKRKEYFTTAELNKLFNAPIYVGCLNDENGYATPGNATPRRGRFWVPLLGLFHGLRLNEACQLHVSDIREKHDIPYLSISDTGEKEEETEKRLKTKQSRRDVPIHPALIRLGFLDFAQKRKQSGDSIRLFPELPVGSKGGYSEIFSKWFIRLVEKTLGNKCEATFHSLRHLFRDAARRARVPVDIVERLAGWEGDRSSINSMATHYGGGSAYFQVLAEEMAKIDYPGLNLEHLAPVH